MDMQLRVLTPVGVALDQSVTQIDFEAIDGFFTLLPRHMDMVSALKAGILSYRTGESLQYIACNQGVLVKKGAVVSVSTKMAIMGSDLTELEQKIATDFKQIEQERKEMNVSLAKLELGLTKGIISLQRGGGADGVI